MQTLLMSSIVCVTASLYPGDSQHNYTNAKFISWDVPTFNESTTLTTDSPRIDFTKNNFIILRIGHYVTLSPDLAFALTAIDEFRQTYSLAQLDYAWTFGKGWCDLRANVPVCNDRNVVFWRPRANVYLEPYREENGALTYRYMASFRKHIGVDKNYDVLQFKDLSVAVNAAHNWNMCAYWGDYSFRPDQVFNKGER